MKVAIYLDVEFDETESVSDIVKRYLLELIDNDSLEIDILEE